VAPARSKGASGNTTAVRTRSCNRAASAPLVRSCCSRPAVLLVASVFTACASCWPCGAAGDPHQPAARPGSRMQTPPSSQQAAPSGADPQECSKPWLSMMRTHVTTRLGKPLTCQQRLAPRLSHQATHAALHDTLSDERRAAPQGPCWAAAARAPGQRGGLGECAQGAPRPATAASGCPGAWPAPPRAGGGAAAARRCAARWSLAPGLPRTSAPAHQRRARPCPRTEGRPGARVRTPTRALASTTIPCTRLYLLKWQK